MISPPGGPQITVSDPVSVLEDGGYNAWPGLAADGSDLVGSVSVGTTHAGSPPWDNEGGIIESADDGATWSPWTQLTPSVSGTSRYIAGGIIVLASGRWVFPYWKQENTAGNPSTMFVRYSDNAGGTWSVAAAVTGWNTQSAMGSQPLYEHVASGRLLLTFYGKASGETNYKCGVVISTDDGATWGAPILVGLADNAKNLTEASFIEDASNDLVMFIRSDESNPSTLYRATSTDDGSTWSSPVSLGFSVTPGMPTAVVVPDNDITLLLHRAPSTQRAVYRWSSDYGATWSNATPYHPTGYVNEYAGAVAVSGTEIAVLYAVDAGAGEDSANPGQCDVWYVLFTVTVA